jgi:cob(I)alamin adenosyltransferase
VRLYTRGGDDGTTGLHRGGRVAKDDAAVEAYGTVDEAQAFLGLARADAARGSELDRLLVGVQRDLWVLMAELATPAARREGLTAGESRVSPDMVASLEAIIDDVTARFPMPAEFVVPGQHQGAALLDAARTVVRRAERRAVPVAADGSLVVAYLNRLSDLLWALARWQEGRSLPARGEGP